MYGTNPGQTPATVTPVQQLPTTTTSYDTRQVPGKVNGLRIQNNEINRKKTGVVGYIGPLSSLA